jgi:predicted secreted protein
MNRRLWELIRERLKTSNRRLLAAIACYLILIGLALYALLPVRTRSDGFLLTVVLGFVAYLMIKTLAHAEDD